MMQKGVRDRLDVARSESQVDQTRALIPSYEILEAQAINRLAVLTREPIGDLEKLLSPEGGAALASPQTVSIGVPADLLRRRPDIRMAERRVASACARVGAATADLYPKFSIVGNFAMQSASVSDLFAWPSRAYSVGPTVTWPIFDAGRIRSNIKIRDMQLDQALILYESTVEMALEETRDALIGFRKEQERSLALTDAVRADGEAVELAQKQYKEGIADFLVVLDAQRQWLNSQDALARSQTQSITSLISLYKALGGGWDAPLDSMPAPAMATTAPASPETSAPTSQPDSKSQR
jgi:NodT family efflux transporter outer membrane factor (OMF) lipoprotein